MKKKQFESLCRKLTPHLPTFVCKGWLLYSLPMNHLLRGFCCDGSGFDPAKITVTVFVLPLFVPTTHVHFLFGNRLKDDRGCDIWWDVNHAHLTDDLLFQIKAQGIPFLNRIESPRSLVDVAAMLPSTQEAYKWETIAYSLAMVDDYAGAQQGLDRLVKALDAKIGWQAEMMERAKRLSERLRADPHDAKQLLAEWEQTTVSNLGL